MGPAAPSSNEGRLGAKSVAPRRSTSRAWTLQLNISRVVRPLQIKMLWQKTRAPDKQNWTHNTRTNKALTAAANHASLAAQPSQAKAQARGPCDVHLETMPYNTMEECKTRQIRNAKK
mmetsp:Transcript_54600/g.151206  ORF Transcript_54600/g.151206 Transcript_54600/m.151206 type:complete len:118 (-) Transcript_54600:145-498(-)